MHTVFGLNFFVFCILALFLIMYFTKEIRDEGFFSEDNQVKEEPFGASPGTFDQLRSTRVPPPTGTTAAVSTMHDPNRRPEQEMEDMIQSNLTKKALMEMTESGMQGPDYASA
jgi:hypothetical protein